MRCLAVAIAASPRLATAEENAQPESPPAVPAESGTRLGGDSEIWSVTLGVKNLTDVRVLNQVTDAVFFPGTFYAQQYPAREFFGSVRLMW